MKSRNKNVILGLTFIALCIAAGTWGIIRRQNLKNKRMVCIAQVNNYVAGSSDAEGIQISYTIEVNGKSYKGTSFYQMSDISTSTVESTVLHKTFPAVYDPADPSKSSIMILPEDFDNNGFAFPDSLSWLLPYIKTLNSPVKRIR